MSDQDLPIDGFARRLARGAELDADDVAAIRRLPGTIRVLEPSSYLAREGDPSRFCAFLSAGFVYRQKLTNEGARQIVSLHIPGDALDLQSLYLNFVDHNLQALTRAEVLVVPQEAVKDLVATRPQVARAIIVDILTEASVAREWLLNIGRRDARVRLAHLLCEFATRMDAQGLGDGKSYELPMTQEQLGDALGLTSVHVNRTLKGLEDEGVLTRDGRRIQFENWEAFRRIADFSPLYLHLDQRARGFSRVG